MGTWIANGTQNFKCRLFFLNLNVSFLSGILLRIETTEVLIFETFVGSIVVQNVQSLLE